MQSNPSRVFLNRFARAAYQAGAGCARVANTLERDLSFFTCRVFCAIVCCALTVGMGVFYRNGWYFAAFASLAISFSVMLGRSRPERLIRPDTDVHGIN